MQLSFRKLQIVISQTADFISQTTDFSFRKLQIFISFCSISFHFAPFRFATYSKPSNSTWRKQLWLSNLVKQFTEFYQCQQEFFVTKNMIFSDCCVTRWLFNRGNCFLGVIDSQGLASLLHIAFDCRRFLKMTVYYLDINFHFRFIITAFLVVFSCLVFFWCRQLTIERKAWQGNITEEEEEEEEGCPQYGVSFITKI